MIWPVVIIGGGAGGLELAARLGRRLGPQAGPRSVLLVDRSIFHLWKPSLHEVAAGSLDSHQEGLSYPTLARRNHFSFALGDLEALDAEAHEVVLTGGAALQTEGLAARRIAYGSLVLATGSGSNLFGTRGAAEHAYVLEDVADAEAFNRRLTVASLSAAYGGDKDLAIAIVGAGATGVELAAELLDGHRAFCSGVAETERYRLHVTIVEAAERILGAQSESLAKRASRALQARGVTLMTGAAVSAVTPQGLETSRGPVRANLVVWAAGVKASERNRSLGPRTGRLNQFLVDDRLRTSEPDVFAIGDCAEGLNEDGRPWPARAQLASQQAAYLASVLTGPARARSAPFRYRDRGSLVSLGASGAVGALMGRLLGPDFLIEGLAARWAYIGLHLDHHRVVLGIPRTCLLILSRMMHRRVSGRVKLH